MGERPSSNIMRQSKVTVRYVDEMGYDLVKPIVLNGQIGMPYLTQIVDFPNYFITELPQNMTGEYTDDPTVEVIYHYKKEAIKSVLNDEFSVPVTGQINFATQGKMPAKMSILVEEPLKTRLDSNTIDDKKFDQTIVKIGKLFRAMSSEKESFETSSQSETGVISQNLEIEASCQQDVSVTPEIKRIVARAETPFNDHEVLPTNTKEDETMSDNTKSIEQLLNISPVKIISESIKEITAAINHEMSQDNSHLDNVVSLSAKIIELAKVLERLEN
ncbi:hypothetical protein Hs30E_17080 [Lactococcus hodotermopsidis]|uniref:MucBP domain-containing protein n=1 Tax=Pseudolactococcus hodotermopsidis TaxID=2709157 RepID=A0A6A0BH82_9LACT|nr:MucBP domain-containing protein [Lactococcus hodotermopsidis]GFH43157.1 hypothetical protein Hs30E_17080 [Lactococcus hodotermopsidis]